MKKAPARAKSKASIQKMLNEAERVAKKEREEKLKAQQQAEADEMALIMAKIDVTSKSATSAFRRRKSWYSEQKIFVNSAEKKPSLIKSKLGFFMARI